MRSGSTRALRRILTVALLAAPLVSCAAGSDKVTAEAAVIDFHAQYNALAFDKMYATAAEEFRARTAESDWMSLMQAVRRKAGMFASTQQTTWQVNAGTGETAVNLVYNSTFTDLRAVERFSFAIRGNKAVLVGYRIESPALVDK